MSRLVEPHLNRGYSRYGLVDQITLCKVIARIYKGTAQPILYSRDSTTTYHLRSLERSNWSYMGGPPIKVSTGSCLCWAYPSSVQVSWA